MFASWSLIILTLSYFSLCLFGLLGLRSYICSSFCLALDFNVLVVHVCSYGGQGFQVRLHAALGFFITLLITLLGVKYQQDTVSPFEANPPAMLVFMGFLSFYVVGLMAVVMMRSRTKGRRGLAVALLLWHLSLISGLFASASLLFLLVPPSFWWILMVPLCVLLLIAAPCQPIGLFYSKFQNQLSQASTVSSAAAHNRSEEADANIPDLEKNLHPSSDIHDSNEEHDFPNSTPKGELLPCN